MRPVHRGPRGRLTKELRCGHCGKLLAVKAERCEGLRQGLASLSPRKTLRRGYAIVQRLDSGDGEVVTDAAQVATGDRLGVTLDRGGLEAEVTASRAGDGGPDVESQHTT